MRALITGASSGIGRDMARYLASLGWNLVVVARRTDRLLELKEELKNCERLLKQTEMLFHMTVEEDLIEARIYELKSLAKVRDYLIGSIRQLAQAENSESETVLA